MSGSSNLIPLVFAITVGVVSSYYTFMPAFEQQRRDANKPPNTSATPVQQPVATPETESQPSPAPLSTISYHRREAEDGVTDMSRRWRRFESARSRESQP